MKRREFIITNLLLLTLVILFSYWTFNANSNKNIRSLFEDLVKSYLPEDTITIETDDVILQNCTSLQKLELTSNDDPELLKLEEYQGLCNSYVTDTLMIFTQFPSNSIEATTLGLEMADKLRLYSTNKVKPIVVVEPYIQSGPMEYYDYIEGYYDIALNDYFNTIKSEGITDEMMGTWVPFPESNTPNWANKDTKPSDFAIVINKYLGLYKSFFPTAKSSILLNATTYDPNDLEWNNGDYLNLNQYLIDVNDDLVDSIGIQGFPWVSNAKAERKQIFDANEFLQPDIAISAAQELRTRNIWFNTGSFGSKYTNDPERTIKINQNDRKAILFGIIDTAMYVKNYQQNEYRVMINLFSEDKSELPEATDWSYNQDVLSQEIFKEFINKATFSNIPIGLFDR
jgi:hypothetical protein